MTDLWVHTVEPIATPKPPPHLRSLYEAAASVSLASDGPPVDYRNPMAIDFDIGLWKVCPSVKEWIHSEYASKLLLPLLPFRVEQALSSPLGCVPVQL